VGANVTPVTDRGSEQAEWLQHLEQAYLDHGLAEIPPCPLSAQRASLSEHIEQTEWLHSMEKHTENALTHFLHYLLPDDSVLSQVDRETMFHLLLHEHSARDLPETSSHAMLRFLELRRTPRNAGEVPAKRDAGEIPALRPDISSCTMRRQLDCRLDRDMRIHLVRDPMFHTMFHSARGMAGIIPLCIWIIPEWLLDDDDFVLRALQIKSDNFTRLRPWFLIRVWTRLQERFRDCKDIARLAIQTEPWCAVALDSRLLQDRELLLIALQTSGTFLQLATPECQANQDIVLLAVQQSGTALEFASAALRANHDVALTAVQQKGEALQFAEPEVRDDRVIVVAAIKQSPLALQFASASLRADHELVSMAVRQTGMALRFAEPELQEERDIVNLAVRQSGAALQFASHALRADREMVLTAIKQSAWALDFASPELKADPEMLGAAICTAIKCDVVRQGSHETLLVRCLELLAKVVRTDGLVPLDLHVGPFLRAYLVTQPLVAVALVQKNPSTYKGLDDTLKSNRAVALAAVELDWGLLADVPFATRNDFAIQVAACKQNRTAFLFILNTDRKRISVAIEQASGGHREDIPATSFGCSPAAPQTK